MKKLLIAVNSQVVSEDFQNRLDKYCRVLCCHSGTEAISLLSEFRPDVLVIDLMLPDLDGITVIKAVRAAGIFPRTVALSDYISSYIVSALEQLEVCRLFRYGIDMRAIAATVLQLIEDREELGSVRSDIRNFIAMLGFRMNNGTSNIIETALELYMRDPSQTFSSALYPATASLCGGSPGSVERAVRYGIECAWKNRNEAIWQLYFAVGKNGRVSKPTNADFLARASCGIRNMRRGIREEEPAKEKTGS